MISVIIIILWISFYNQYVIVQMEIKQTNTPSSKQVKNLNKYFKQILLMLH